MAKKYNWKVQLPGLVSQAKVEANSALNSNHEDKFTEWNFHQHLVNSSRTTRYVSLCSLLALKFTK